MNDLLSEKDARVVEDILTRELAVEREQLVHDAQLMEDLGADSLTLVESGSTWAPEKVRVMFSRFFASVSRYFP